MEVVMNSSVTEIITLENIMCAPLQIDSVRLAVGGAGDFHCFSAGFAATLLTVLIDKRPCNFPAIPGIPTALEIVSNDADSLLTTVSGD